MYMLLMASLANQATISNSSQMPIDWSSQMTFCKLGKIKKQVLVLYPNRQYAFYQVGANNKCHFDTGAYKYQSLTHNLKFTSLLSASEFNALTKNSVKIKDNEVYIPKDKTSYKPCNKDEVSNTMAMFNTLKAIEIKNKPLDALSLKRGYKLEVINHLDAYKHKISNKDGQTLVYQKGQKTADSLYQIQVKRGINKKYQAVYDLSKNIVKNASTDSAKLRLLCDWMTCNFEYLLEGTVDPAELIKAKATRCEGYANFILELCKPVNIPCIKVIGTADNGSLDRYKFSEQSGRHAWNLVKIQGQWRPLDVTWLDPTWPKGYKHENRVYGNEQYFNPNLEQLCMTHMPDISELALTNFSPLGTKAFCNNPVIKHYGDDIQYVGTYNNRIYTKNPSLLFEFYTTQAQSITLSKGKHEAIINIPLKEGINQISIASPEQLTEITFENSQIKAVFYINPGKSNITALNAALNDVKSYDWAYHIEFYEFMLKVAKSNQIVIKNNQDSTGKINSLAKTVIDQYDGKCPAGAWQFNHGNANKNPPVAMRFYFTETTIEGKRLYAECQVACKQEETSMLNPKKFPCSNWHLGLE